MEKRWWSSGGGEKKESCDEPDTPSEEEDRDTPSDEENFEDEVDTPIEIELIGKVVRGR